MPECAGKSADVDARIEQHRQGGGALVVDAWGGVANRLPTITPAGRSLESWEMEETLEQMKRHGCQSVRGSAWTSAGALEPDELKMIETLTLTLGDLCYECGRPGHCAAACTACTPIAWLAALRETRISRAAAGDCLAASADAHRVKPPHRRPQIHSRVRLVKPHPPWAIYKCAPKTSARYPRVGDEGCVVKLNVEKGVYSIKWDCREIKRAFGKKMHEIECIA